MRIVMIGQRGVPASFGGVERHVEELGSRLAARGHDVTVYCRRGYSDDDTDTYRGMSLRSLPTIGTKHLDAIVHSALSTLDAMRGDSDIIHFHALGPGTMAFLPRLARRSKVVLTVHGRDDLRAKWSLPARTVLGFAGWMSGRVPHATIAVSQALASSYATRTSHQTVYIPNGVPEGVGLPDDSVRGGPADRPETLQRLGLLPGKYLLWVGRLVPEKAPDLLVRAFSRLRGADLRLVVVGGSSFTDDYTDRVRALASKDPRVCLAGYQYGGALADLYRYALAFVLPSELEGLPLTLLEAVAHGLPVVTSDIPPHLEVIGAVSLPGRRVFPAGSESALVGALEEILADPAGERKAARALREDVMRRYSWDKAAEATEQLYEELLAGRRRAPGA